MDFGPPAVNSLGEQTARVSRVALDQGTLRQRTAGIRLGSRVSCALSAVWSHLAPARHTTLNFSSFFSASTASEFTRLTAASISPRRSEGNFLAGAGLLQLVGAGLMIAVLKRSGFDNRKRPQRFNRAGRNHAFVFSGSYDKLPGYLSIAPKRKICKSLIAVRINSLADGAPRILPTERRIHPNASERFLIKHPARSIASDSTHYFIT